MLQATVFPLSVLPASCNILIRGQFKNSAIASACAAVDVALHSHSNAFVLYSYLRLGLLHHLHN